MNSRRFPVPTSLASKRARFAAEFDARVATAGDPPPPRSHEVNPTVAARIAEERKYADERPMRRAFRP